MSRRCRRVGGLPQTAAEKAGSEFSLPSETTDVIFSLPIENCTPQFLRPRAVFSSFCLSHLPAVVMMCDMKRKRRPRRRPLHPYLFPFKCVQCGNPFLATRADARLCGPACRQAFSREQRARDLQPRKGKE